MFRKLKRVWSRNDFSQIPNFTKVFPELNRVPFEELCDRWQKLGVDLYTEKAIPVKWWIRFTLPFALIVMLIMTILIPVNFLFTGNWGYTLGDKSRLINWFRSLHLLRY